MEVRWAASPVANLLPTALDIEHIWPLPGNGPERCLQENLSFPGQDRLKPATVFSAWSRSAMMSCTSSMPTDRRTNSGVTPVWTCSSGVSCEWVVVAGWIMSDFASPMLRHGLNNLTLSISLVPASLPPLMPKPTMAPWPLGRYFFALA